MSEFKAQAMARELKSRIEFQSASVSSSIARDANEMPTLIVTKGADSIFIKIQTDKNAGRVDALGLAQRSYSPHVVRFLRETAANQSQAEFQILALAEASKLGCKIEVWEKAVPAASDLPADVTAAVSGASKVAEIKSDMINPMISSQ